MIGFKQASMPAAGAAPGRGHPEIRRRVRAALLALVALLASTATGAADYVNDPSWGWGSGRMIEDAFYGPADQNYDGRALAKLDEGDVVVAGSVPHSSGFGAIGLVRYAADGTSGRVTWSNPGAYGTNGNQYVVYPGASAYRIVSVRKVLVHGSLMFVLADTDFSESMTDATVFVFGTDGSYKVQYTLDTAFRDSGDQRTVWSGGIATYTTQTATPTGFNITHHLVYAGRKKVATGNERVTFRRYTFTTAGVLTAATNLIHPDIAECGAATHCSGFDIALGGSLTLGGAPRVYLTGSRYSDCTGICYGGWWAYAAQISPASGASTGMGFRYMIRGRGRAIAVNPSFGIGGTRDDIYVLAERDRDCKNGMAIGAYRQEAPFSWEKVVGGSDASGAQCAIATSVGIRTVVPTSLVLQDGRLAAAGWGIRPPAICVSPPCEDIVDGAIAVLDAGNGNLISPAAAGANQPRYYAFTDAAGTRTKHSGFHDIAAAGDGRFTVAGNTRYPSTHATPAFRGKLQYAALRVLESSGSGTLPFSDGFEGDGGQPPELAQFRGTNIGGMTLAYSYCPSAGAGPVPGSHFHTFDPRLVDYYADKGMKALRLMFTWECMQKELNGPIPAAASGNYKAYFDNFRQTVDYATNVKGMHLVMTPWQSNAGGALCGACYRGNRIGTAQVSNAHFADFWTKMANHFKDNPRVGFSLINEPNYMSTMTWFSAAQAAITAIRATGASNRIYVPGNGYSAASTWEMNSYDTATPQRSNSYGWLNARGAGQPLLDPQDNIFVEVHTYVDENQGGLDNGITSVTAARDHVKHTVDWARARGIRVYLGEIGMYAGNALAAQTWSNFMTYANANTDTLIGFTWWAGGYPGWWDNVQASDFSIAPTSAANFTGDTINMDMIEAAFQ